MIFFFAINANVFINKKVSKVCLFIFIQYFVFIFSIINSKDIAYSFQNYFIPNLIIFISIIFIYYSIRASNDIKAILLYFYWISLIMMFIGLFQLIKGSNLNRMSVLGGGPNTYYRFMIQGYILSLYFKPFKNKFSNYAISLLFIIFSLSTGSKGALATLLIIFIFQIFFARYMDMKSKNIIKYILVIMVAGIILWFCRFIIFEKLTEIFPRIGRTISLLSIEEMQNATSNIARINIIKTSLIMFQNNPVFGWGPGGYFLVSNRFGIQHVYPHNIFLEILSEYGLLCFIFFVLMMIFLVCDIFFALRIIKKNKRCTKNNQLFFTLILLFSSYFSASMFSGNIIDSRGVFLFIMMIDIIVRCKYKSDKCIMHGKKMI